MMFDSLEYINSFSRSGKKVTDLSRIKGLLERLGDPHTGQKFVHIAGTNGKGSTLEYISEILIDAGYKTGQFTSPFVEKYNDRIRINGHDIPDKRLEEICLKVKKNVFGGDYSQFEITLAIALIYFVEEACDIVLLETGIGGVLDATNVIESPLLSVITSVSLDHTELLGNTVSEIAKQKAGIIKKGCPVVLSADNNADTIGVVKDTAEKCGSKLIIPCPDMCVIEKSDIYGCDFLYKTGKYHINMCGTHQVGNSITAIEAADILAEKGFSINDENVKNGLSNAKLKLRTEVFNKEPLVIIDGGHNVSGINSLAELLKTLDCSIVGAIGMKKGKDAKYAGERLSEIFDTAVCADGFIENNIEAATLAGYFSCNTETADFKTAVKRIVMLVAEKKAAAVICGSLYFASAARKLLERGNLL